MRGRGDDLFSHMIDEMDLMGPYLRARKRHKEEAADNLRKMISEKAGPVRFKVLAAKAQQRLYLKRSEIGDAMVELSKAGVIEPTWLERGGRKPQADDLIVPT